MKKAAVDKAASLSKTMNKLTEKLDIAEELEVQGDDIIEFIEAKQEDISLYTDPVNPAEIINLETLVTDFKFVRETLRENTQNGRRVLNSITLELLESDSDKRASLIMSFAELNRAVADNMKLYIQSYKEISATLLNMNKIKHAELGGPKSVHNTLNINGAEAISTVDLIQRLASGGDNAETKETKQSKQSKQTKRK